MTTNAGIASALYGIKAEEKRFEILTQNLANLATPGYKAEVGLFESVLVDVQALLGGDATSGEEETVVVQQFSGLSVDTSLGSLRPTANPLDLALGKDEGFFVVETPDGLRYTRRGHFALDAAGQLVTPEGYVVQGQAGAIVLSGGADVAVNDTGEVTLDGRHVDTLRVVSLPEPALLERGSEGLFRWTGDPAAETDMEEPQVVQGSVELSNVNPVFSMAEMVTTLRAYESSQRVLRDLSEAERLAAREIAQLIG